jgi:hypothetical protein
MSLIRFRWFINIIGTGHMLWTGALPGTANDFDEREFIRHRDGLSDEESVDAAVRQ